MATKEDQRCKETKDKEEWSLIDELQRNKQLRKEDFDTLKQFCGTLPDVDISYVTDNLILAILHSCEYDLEKAREAATAHFSVRFSLPEIFTGHDFDAEAFQTALKVGCYCPLTKRTPEGYRIIFQTLRNKDPALYDHVALSKVQILTMEACVHEDPTCPGYVLISDMSGISLSHMWKSDLSITKQLMKFSQEGSALKIQQMHMLNSSSITYYVMKWLNPFLSKHICDMLQLYTTEEMDEFLKVVPKEFLPEDYGGDLPNLDTLCDAHTEWLRTMLPKIVLQPKKS